MVQLLGLRVRKARLAQWVLRVHKVQKALPAPRVQLAPSALLGLPAHRVRRVILAHRVSKVQKATKVRRAQRVQPVQQVRKAKQGQQVRRVPKAPKGCKAPLDLSGRKATKVHPAHRL